MDNSVRYVVTAAGVQFGGMYSTGYDSTIVNGAQVPGASKVGREYELMANYQGKLINAAVLFDQTQGTSIATQDDAQQRIVVGLSVPFKNGSVYAGYRWLNGQNGAAPLSSNLFWTGASYYITPTLSIAARAYHMQLRQSRNGPSSGVILVDYFLSKTTDFYAQVSKMWYTRETNVGLDGAGFNTTFGASQTGGMIGVKHTF